MNPSVLAALVAAVVQLATAVEPAVAEAIIALFDGLTRVFSGWEPSQQTTLLANAQKIATGLRTDHPDWSAGDRHDELVEALAVLTRNVTGVPPDPAWVAALALLVEQGRGA
jgi:hypothetical protein